MLALLPIDIHNKEFKKGLFGYNEDEVNEFLEQVMKDYDIILREKNDVQSEVEELRGQIEHYSNIEGTLNKSIIVAQEAAEELKANAKKESELIVQEAEKNADRIINESLEEARQIRIEMETIKKQAVVFRTRLKMLIEAQLDLVNKDEWNQFLEIEEQSNTKTTQNQTIGPIKVERERPETKISFKKVEDEDTQAMSDDKADDSKLEIDLKESEQKSTKKDGQFKFETINNF